MQVCDRVMQRKYSLHSHLYIVQITPPRRGMRAFISP